MYRIEKLLDPICPCKSQVKSLFLCVINSFCLARDHKLANRNMPPLILMPYHSISSPEPFTLLAFNNSAIGRAVRTWNSPAGVSLDAWDLIVQSNVLCPQCSSCYSIDGFHDHLEEGTCTNGLGPALFNRVDVDKFPVSLTLLTKSPMQLAVAHQCLRLHYPTTSANVIPTFQRRFLRTIHLHHHRHAKFSLPQWWAAL